MVWTITWGIVRGLVSLGLAVAMVSKANTNFEAAAFLAALIAYHRLGFGMSAEALGSLKRGMRAELWFHRLNQMAATPQGVAGLPKVLQDVEIYHPGVFGPGEELEDLAQQVALIEKKNYANGIMSAGIEILLGIGLVFVLLQ